VQPFIAGRIRELLRRCGIDVIRYRANGQVALPVDFDRPAADIIQSVRAHTMTSPERLFAFIQAVRYVSSASIPGDVVECGVWRGGSMMAAARTLVECGDETRTLHLFDTFEGMSAPTDKDVAIDGVSADALLTQQDKGDPYSAWCLATLEDVKAAMAGTRYPPDRIRYVRGKVEDTIPGNAPDRISILRLDTDWYESTRHELEHLFPRLVKGGVLIIDDYGHWKGARQAVDEYLETKGIRLLLNRIDLYRPYRRKERVNAPADTTKTAGGAMRLLNFGCGRTYHRDWTNLDTLPVSPEVIAHDLRRAFPFDDAAFDAVYGSHVLEHLEPAAARRLLQECFRILRPGGIIRIVVPDLESIARLYVSSLEGAVDGDRESELRYDWLMLELYDQAVRKVSGGNMAAYLAENTDRRTSRFVMERIGYEGRQAVDSELPGFSITSRILRRLRTEAESMRRMAVIVSATVFLGRRGAAAVRDGLFRDGGEIHQWMYDRFSMARALAQIGFESVRTRTAGESDIPGFVNYKLEVIDGVECKPDSLYMEGRKAAEPDSSGIKRVAR